MFSLTNIFNTIIFVLIIFIISAGIIFTREKGIFANTPKSYQYCNTLQFICAWVGWIGMWLMIFIIIVISILLLLALVYCMTHFVRVEG